MTFTENLNETFFFDLKNKYTDTIHSFMNLQK